MESKEELLSRIIEYFKTKIFEQHIRTALNTHSKLKSYNLNPIVAKYLGSAEKCASV